MLIRNNPWQLLNELNNIFENKTTRPHSMDDSKVEGGHWVPAVDIKEEADKFILLIDMPGVKPEQVEISMENNVLTLKGTREELKDEVSDLYHRVERVKGSFYRRFTLPDTADAEQVTALSKHGVLEINIGKKKAMQARKIEIKAKN